MKKWLLRFIFFFTAILFMIWGGFHWAVYPQIGVDTSEKLIALSFGKANLLGMKDNSLEKVEIQGVGTSTFRWVAKPKTGLFLFASTLELKIGVNDSCLGLDSNRCSHWEIACNQPLFLTPGTYVVTATQYNHERSFHGKYKRSKSFTIKENRSHD